MSVHQIITGALNKGESVFSVGVIEGISFTACAVGCDIVILDGEFQRVQIIPGSSTGFVQVTAIACCQESGKIAAAFYDFIRIYKPFRVSDSDVRRPENGLNYQWFETFSFPFNSFVTCLSWNLDGLRLLVSSENELQMLQHPIVNDPCNLADSNVNFSGIKFGLETELDSVAVVTKPWKCIWCSKRINSPLRQVKFSPDSDLFATCGKDDRVIRVWFLDSTIDAKSDTGEKLVYNYVCLQHPKPVVGFEWRKSGRYMLRGLVANVLISWCQDHISRIWCETTSITDADLGQPLKAADTTAPNQLDDRQDGRDVRWKILQRFKHLKKKKKAKLDSSLVNNSVHPFGFSNEFFSTSTDELGAGVHFHLSASINPKTDCLLVPSMDSFSQDSTMTVHWLNNKELVFCRGAEKVLAEAVHFENLITGRLSLTVDQKMPHSESRGSDLDQSSTVSVPSSILSQRKDYVDVKLDLLFREWQHSFDVLFAIHPLDGSLLVWTVDYLDNVTRQAQVNFASRLPGVFPLTDAASLHHNLAVLNSTGSFPLTVSTPTSKSSSSSNCKFTSDFLVDQEQQHLSVYLLTTHHNGTLNLWHLNLDEKSNYSHILSITHKSRMCGHRFIVKSVACHPILPLFLTTSHHNVRRKKFVEEQNLKKHSITNSDVQLFNSELILWYVEPVGPLKRSGGVFELSRINSSELSAFSSIAWIPSVLPSSILGQTCNSVSCCFIASDGQCLRIYQAVLDAKALLSDMKFAKQPSMRNNLCENLNVRRRFSTDLPMLNIVSTQSTARPGCIIELDMIADASHEWRHVQLMHVFHEEIMLANNDGSPPQSELLDRSDSTAFHDRFYLVLLERRKIAQGSTTFIVHMWLIGLYVHNDEASLNDIEGHNFQHGDVSSKLHIYSKKVCSQVLPLPDGVKVVDCSPSVGHLSSASLYPSCRAPYLLVTACSDRKFRFWKCNVDDDNNNNKNQNTPVAMSKSLRYTWQEWKMANSKGGPSEIETEGAALRVSCAYSGRIACAYDPEIPMVSSDANVETVNVNVAVYECESTGGIEWVEENLIQLKNIRIQRIAYVPSDADAFSLWWEQSPDWQPNLLEKRQNSMMLRITSAANISTLTKNTVKGCYVEGGSNEFRCRDMVRLGWVSAEDGSHILTIGVGSSIFLYAPVAEDVAQHYVAMMKEPEQGNQKRRGLFRRASTIATRAKHMVRWICLRRVELESADGLPPMPRMLSWVRHGIMVVGLDTEMRIYSQWNMTGTCEANDEGLMTSKSAAVFPTAMSALDLMRKTDAGSKKRRDAREAHGSKEKVAEQWSERFLRLVSFEGLFEAARVATPLLPQYHPRQLIELMKAGQTSMVHAILLHVLNQIRKYDVPRARRCGPALSELNHDLDSDDTGKAISRRPSLCAPEVGLLGDDGSAEYVELDFISPLPLYSLLRFNLNLFNVKNNSNDNSTLLLADGTTTHARNDYDSLLDDGLLKYKIESDPLDDPNPIDHNTTGQEEEEVASGVENSNTFGSKEAALLSSMLTHIHLPGLSSLDQLYLLAIADTISSIKPGSFEQLNFTTKFFNSTFNPRTVVVNQTSTTGLSAEAVDECGLRYLMSVRHFEYLLRCLPLPQRAALRANGLPSANLIWALHSESENELFSSLSCVQRNEANWSDLRSLGVGWWLKSLQSLRLCFEKIAKAAFQAKNDPMDAALFYLAMKKKNVLMHLFKTVRDVKMTEFLSHDFTDAKWKKAALKNAFVLMSKQRFEHAVGWFLLGDSLNDAVKVCLANMNDLQLALVIIRLYEGDSDLARRLIRRVLCEQVLQCEEEVFEETNDQSRGMDSVLSLVDSGGSDPFQRSIALWLMGEPALAASTLLSSSAEPCLRGDPLAADYSSSDVFNFYVYIRAHPLVLRRRLADQGIYFDHAAKFQQAARRMVSRVSTSERMLFFKTAFVHLQGGCPLLALEVLCKLPDCDQIDDDNDDITVEVKQQNNNSNDHTNATVTTTTTTNNNNNNNNNRGNENHSLDQVWQFGDQADYLLNRRDDVDELKFDWNDENNSNLAEEEEEEEVQQHHHHHQQQQQQLLETKQTSSSGEPAMDMFAQTLKFIACMKMLTEELANLIGGFELDIGQMRDQLYKWLENEVDVLKLVCDYRVNVNRCGSPPLPVVEVTYGQGSPTQLHEAIHHDRAELAERWQRTIKRHRWLVAHQQVLRTLAYFCSLHCSRSPGLAASRMELLLLIQELTQNLSRSKLTVRMPLFASFPLMSAALGSVKSAVALPLRYILSQTSDILITLSELQNPPTFQQPVQEIHLLYNLCQCLSSSVFCSLCDLGEIISSKDEFLTESNSYLQRNIFRRNSAYQQNPIQVTSKPSQWPGIDLSSSFLTTDRDEDVPNLLILLVETWTSIYLSLFAYCMYAYDSRWLYRLMAHPVNENLFATVFGGSGERQLLADTLNSTVQEKGSCSSGSSDGSYSKNDTEGTMEQLDSAKLRAKFHYKVFGKSASNPSQPTTSHRLMSSRLEWVQPKKSIIAYYTSKPPLLMEEEEQFGYDSDDSEENSESESENEDPDESTYESRAEEESKEHSNPNSYSWQIIRLALVRQATHRVRQFLAVAGIDCSELGSTSPLVYSCLKMLNCWTNILTNQLNNFPGGCPDHFLPSSDLHDLTGGPALHKYRTILEPQNTPFRGNSRSVLPVRRLWLYLVRQEHLMDVFIRYIFTPKKSTSVDESNGVSPDVNILPEAFKVVQREHDPINAFVIHPNRFGLVAVSSGRELQEMDVSALFSPTIDWIQEQTDLDLVMAGMKKNPLIDNDDYLLITPQERRDGTLVTGRGTTYAIANESVARLERYFGESLPPVVLLPSLCKRHVPGVRRLEAHPTLPFYLSGANDGSVRLWEWGVGQPLYTPRVGGRFGKVTQTRFCAQGNKFGISDSDGFMCLWQIDNNLTLRKPFINMKCHSKICNDFVFLGQSSSLLATAGQGSVDAAISLWDTLLPPNRYNVHTWNCHTDVTNCLLHVPNQQTLLCGGKHGDLHVWDVRQRQLRLTVKLFDSSGVRSLAMDPTFTFFAAGSTDGDIKVYNLNPNPQLVFHFPHEHSNRSTFSLRQVGSANQIHGVQMMYIDQQQRLYSCGADCSFKLRVLPPIF